MFVVLSGVPSSCSLNEACNHDSGSANGEERARANPRQRDGHARRFDLAATLALLGNREKQSVSVIGQQATEGESRHPDKGNDDRGM